MKSATRAGFPGPVQRKALAMPAHRGVRLDEGERPETARPEAVEPYPEEALAATETEPFAVSGSSHRQLLTQSEALQVQDGTASEEAGEGGEQREEQCVVIGLSGTKRPQRPG